MNTWQTIWNTVAEDFSDIPDAAQATRITIRLALAASLGGMIGYEREAKGKAAGLRTHMLVSLGSALFVLVVQQSGGSADSVSRVIQGLVAGIGFLGAGVILNNRRDPHIRGLTTAAGVWMTAAIGVAAGLGRELTAILATVLALVVLAVLPRFERWLIPQPGPTGSPPTPPPEPPPPQRKRSSRRA
jgi:putative Mg2+ transporter-C (MgtC) family protein